MHEHRLPVQQACRVVRLSRTAYYQPPLPASRRDAAVIAALTDAVARYPRWGFWKLYDRLRADGQPWNHKRLHRVYCALRLNLPRRTTRRVPKPRWTGQTPQFVDRAKPAIPAGDRDP